MDNTIDKLIIGIGFDVKQLSNSAKQVEDVMGTMSKDIKTKLSTALDVFTTGFGLNFAKNMVEGFANVGANLQFLSRDVKENVSTLAVWQEAFKRVGGTAESASAQIKSTYERVRAALYHGDPTFFGQLGRLGINPKDEQGNIKKTTDIMVEAAKKIHALPTDLQYGAAQNLGFNEDFLRIIRESGNDLDGLFDRLKKLGVATAERSRQDLELKRTWQDVTQVWDNAARTIASKLYPELLTIGKFFSSHPEVIQRAAKSIMELTAGFLALRVAVIALGSPFRILLTLATGLYEIFDNRDLIKNWAKKEDLQWLVDLMDKLDSLAKSVSDTFSSKKISAAVDSAKNSAIGHTNVATSPGVVGDLVRWVKRVNSMPNGGQYKSAQDFINDEALAQRQKMKESSGKSGIVSYDSKGNPHVGLYQISPYYASKMLGRNVSIDELKNPKFNREIRDKFLLEQWGLSKGNASGALSWFHGGAAEYNQLLKSGRNPKYAESLLGSVQQMPAQTNNNNKKVTNVSINNMQVQGIKSPQQFVQGLADPSAPGWTYGGPILA